MDVIITVMNRLFDENDPYYIGVKEDMINIHPKGNTIKNNIEKSPHVSLKNKGVRMIYTMPGNIPEAFIPYRKTNTTLRRRKTRNNTRKKFPKKITPSF